MSGLELRRFVGGPFPNLVSAPAGAGVARGPFPNLVPAERPRAAVQDLADRVAERVPARA
jgi:hypothetical protein